MIKCVVLSSLFLSISLGSPLGAYHKWDQFKLAHNKVYDTIEEETYRAQMYRANLKDIEEHNQKYKDGRVSWYKGVNHFSDMTSEEFAEYISNSDLPREVSSSKAKQFKASSLRSYPNKLDLRIYLNRVRDQGGCGCCYAFASVSAIEASYAKKNYKRAILSPQNIVDCTEIPEYGNRGCNGGFLSKTLEYVEKVGLMAESDYAFTGVEGNCTFDASKSVLKLSDFAQIHNAETDLIGALNEKGVLAVAVDAKEWQHYEGGIFKPSEKYRIVNHAVVLAGYGVTDYNSNTEYWIVRNSWGEWWGDDGEIRIARKFEGDYHVGIGAPKALFSALPVYPVA